MNWLHAVGAAISLALFIYLLYALFRPERF
jgi:K+-transporting ATPase KdpF subunit